MAPLDEQGDGAVPDVVGIGAPLAHEFLSRPAHERLAEFGRTAAVDMDLDEDSTDRAALAVHLEFVAAVLRNTGARQRYAAELGRRLHELAAADEDQPRPGTTLPNRWPSATRC